MEPLLPRLAEANLIEQALLELKHHQPHSKQAGPWQAFRNRLEALAEQARERRKNQWQMDPRRRTLRLRMEVRHPVCDLHPSAFQALLADVLMRAGLPLALGLEKSPRPMVRLGHPLPLGVEGLDEKADVALQEPSTVPPDELPGTIQAHCPEGLVVRDVAIVPNYASSVLDLCREAVWTWPCPQEELAAAAAKLTAFLASETYQIEKTGKVGGQKQTKRVEVRPLVLDAAWEGSTLVLTTRLTPDQAMNPLKLLAGILELPLSALAGITRRQVVLGDDERLASAEKYEPKLHNIFEDAVLLGSTSNIQIVEEEDDDPILLKEGDDPSA